MFGVRWHFLSRSQTRASPSRTAESWHWLETRIPKNGGPPGPQSTEKMEETRSQIERMFELDLMEPSKSPYYTHAQLVRKLAGKWRFSIDFRTINDLCGNIGWPIPNIALTLEWIGSKKSKVFAKFDMISGYFQMAFDPSICDATLFISWDSRIIFAIMSPTFRC
jgi:hypothetical protein